MQRKKLAVFKKSDDDDRLDKASSPRIGQVRPVRSKNVSVIASTRVFKGRLSAAEGLIIEGHLECTIAHHKKHLTVGEHGRVKADIHANTVIVLGQLIGDIYSEGMVSLAKGSDVKGNIFCACLDIEDGARFEGKINMGELPDIAVMPKDSMQEGPVRTEKIRPHVAMPGIPEDSINKADIVDPSIRPV